MNRNIPLLAASQAIYWCGQVIGIVVASIVGQSLAPDPLLATLPIACITLGNIVITRSLSQVMQRHGRRAGFALGSGCGIVGGLINVAAIWAQSFWLFAFGCLILGVYQASSQYYRLAATDSATPETRGRAISYVLMGSIVAALVGKPLADWAKDLVPLVTFAGSYLVFTMCAVGTLALQPFMTFGRPAAGAGVTAGGRPTAEIVRQPLFRAAIANAAVGQGIMIMVMQATPLAVLGCGFPITDGSWVIQWHVLGMFVPAFFTGRLIDRFGAAPVALAGIGLLTASAAVAISGVALTNFLVSSCLLGFGWNFMYVAGTSQIAASHRPEERGRVQGMSEFSIACLGAAASFAAGGLLNLIGWSAVNIGILPLLAVAAVLNFDLIRRRPMTAAA